MVKEHIEPEMAAADGEMTKQLENLAIRLRQSLPAGSGDMVASLGVKLLLASGINIEFLVAAQGGGGAQWENLRGQVDINYKPQSYYNCGPLI